MKKITIFLLALLCVNKVYMQINIGGKPFSFGNYNIEKNIPIYKTSKLDLEKLKKEDEQDEQDNVPPRFGFKHKVNITTENSGKWTTLPNGDMLWQLEIHCPDAKSINFTFNQFWLPENSVMYVYNKSRTHVIGGFTSKNNKSEDKNNLRGFATGLVFGETVLIEYYQKKESENPIISINNIVHGYRYIPKFWKTKSSLDLGESGSCQVDINCSEGDDWQDEKKGVALILVDGHRYCTGSLINNTCNDGTLFFLTANHCLGGWANSSIKDAVTNPNLDDWSFLWNYETPDCNNQSAPEPQLFETNGATVIANNPVTDFALIELSESPLDLVMPQGVGFNGWNTTNNPPSGGVGIHHPSGDVKKIATHNLTPTNGIVYGNNYWRISPWSSTSNGFSITEGGSSGSPLFTTEGQIIGQLKGGSTINCSEPINDPAEYGKFSKSWNQNIWWKRQLKHWLDKCETGDTDVDGIKWDCEDVIYVDQPIYYSPFNNTAIIKANQSIIGSNLIQAPLNRQFLAGDNIVLEPNFHTEMGTDFLARIMPCNPTEFVPISSKRNYTIDSIIIDDKYDIEEIVQNDDLIIYPNPTNNSINIVLTSKSEDVLSLNIFDVNSKNVYSKIIKLHKGLNRIKNIDLSNYTNGIYFVEINTNETSKTKKIILKK